MWSMMNERRPALKRCPTRSFPVVRDFGRGLNRAADHISVFNEITNCYKMTMSLQTYNYNIQIVKIIKYNNNFRNQT